MTQQFENFWVKVDSEDEFYKVKCAVGLIGYRPVSVDISDNYDFCEGFVGCICNGTYVNCNCTEDEYLTYLEFMAQYGNTAKENEVKDAQQMSPLPEGVSIVYKDKQGNAHNTVEEAVEANLKIARVDRFVKYSSVYMADLVLDISTESSMYAAETLARWLLDNKDAVMKLYGMEE